MRPGDHDLITRRDAEDPSDHVQRVMLSPLYEGATDAEIAYVCMVPTELVRGQRAALWATQTAQKVAADIDWPGTLPELVHAALLAFAAQHCEARRCAHVACGVAEVSFLSVLQAQGVTLRLVGDDRFVSDPKDISPEVRAYIVDNRAAIVAELRAAAIA